MSETINVNIGGENVSVVIEGGNLAAGASIALESLNTAVATATEAASDASVDAQAAQQAATDAQAAETAAEQAAQDAIAAMATKLDKTANLGDVDNTVAARTNIRTPLAYTAEQFSGASYNVRASAAASAAFAADAPVEVTQGTATIDLNVQGYSPDPLVRWQYLQSFFKWAGKARVANNARLRVRLSPGPHEVTVNRDADGIAVIRWTKENPTLEIDGQTNPTFIALASPPVIGTRSGDVYPVTLVLASAVPSHITVGAPFGLSNMKGDNDMEALSGAGIVKTISGDRLTITYDFVAPRTTNLVSPTTIDTSSTDYSMLASRVVFWGAWLSVDTNASTASPGWNGVTDGEEGVFQLYDGAVANIRRFAMVWRGSVGSEYHQDLIFARDNGTQVSIATSCLVGAPEKCIRQYGDAKVYVDQSYIGGGGKGEMGVMVQNGADVDLVQTCIGGFTADAVQSGVGAAARAAGCIITSGEYGVRAIGCGSYATTLNCRIAGNASGVYADEGASIQVANGSFPTYVSRNDVGLTRVNDSMINGSPTFSGNTSDSNAVANLMDANGLWAKDNTGLAIAIGGGATITKALKVSVSFNVASVPATSVSKQTVAVTGAAVGDFLVVDTAFDLPAGLSLGQSRVSAENTVTLNYINPTAGAVDQGSITYNFLLIRAA